METLPTIVRESHPRLQAQSSRMLMSFLTSEEEAMPPGTLVIQTQARGSNPAFPLSCDGETRAGEQSLRFIKEKYTRPS